MEKNNNEQPSNQDVKWLLIVIAVLYGISFMPAGEAFEHAKTNYRSNKGPQPMQLASSSEFFQGLSNSFSEIYVGYGAFTKIFNQKAGEQMIINAAIASYKEPYQSSDAWGLGSGVGLLLRLSLLFLLVYKTLKM